MKKWCVGVAAIVFAWRMQRQGRHERRSGESRETEDLYAGRCRQEMKESGVQLSSTQEDLKEFREGSSELRGCQDTDYLFVARMRNSKVDKQVFRSIYLWRRTIKTARF